ncbi:MAG: AAA family ATPase, partial [Hyphomicrobiales bacterium]|nr:AAA family ATPase [Hyphomicrobiales bacterium]
ALAAILALLYGVPERSAYVYRFPGQELRIGAEIVGRDGVRFVFRRRKGRKNTLQDEAGTTLPDEALAPFLGGVDEDAFRRTFGLDAAALRDGGDAMLRSDGDVGASLLEAASGLRNLLELRKSLEDEADGVFGERKAGHRQFYQALERHAAARKAIEAKELRVEAWRRLNTDIEALGETLDAIREGRRANQSERARLSRLRRAAPALQEIADVEARLAAYADAPNFAPGEADALDAAIVEVREAVEAVQRAEADERCRVEDAARIAVDQATLSEAAAIEDLFGRSGAYMSEARDLPRIQAEADRFAAALERHAGALGLKDPAALEQRRPTAAVLAALRALIGEGRKAQADAEAQALRLAKERKALDGLRREREQRPAALDPSPLRERYLALGRVAERARKAAEDRLQLLSDERELGEASARLDPPVAALAALACRPLPSAEDVSRLERAFEEAREQARAAAQKRKGVEKEMAGATARLAVLAAGRPLATAERIEDARARRGEAWAPLRAALLDAPRAPRETLAHQALDFERLVAEADRLADEGNADAERLAKHALETQRLDEQTRLYALAQAEEARAEAGIGEVSKAWSALWQAVCDEPRAPAAMRAWLDRIAELLGDRDRLLQRRAALEAQERTLAKAEPALAALSAELGLPPIDGLDVALLAERVERRMEQVARAFDAARDLETRLDEARRRVDGAMKDETEATAARRDWRGRADAMLVAAGVSAGSGVEAAEAALDVWAKSASDGENHRDRTRRVAGMKRNMEAFEEAAHTLAMRCAPEAADLQADAIARRLNERLAAARKAEAQRIEAARGVEQAGRRLRAARESRERAEACLARLTAHLPAGADPVVLVAQERERAHLAETLCRHRGNLLKLSDGVDETRLVEEMLDFDPDAAAARIAELERDDEEKGREENQSFADRAELLRRRIELESGVGAEEAWQQRRNAEAELVEAARRWVTLKAASALLDGALDRHRAARRDPLMVRAGEIFALLRQGAFARLDQDFGEDDELQLVGVRPGGETVRVKAMSEGERDQLYLALRLALLESYASRAEAPPFIGDDILPSFDDESTLAGLEALAAIGDRVQPILFTHHLHVIEAAGARLGRAVDIIRLDADSAAALAA